MDEKTIVFGNDSAATSSLMSVLSPLLSQRGIDPNLLLTMNNGNGFGGNGNFFWVLFLLLLWNRGGFGGWGNNGNGNGCLAAQLNDNTGRAVGNMRLNALNTGFTYSNLRVRRSVVVIGRAESGAEFLNSYCHELRHLVDDIARADGMELSGEPVAYLSGDICNAVADIVCKMACDCCRRR